VDVDIEQADAFIQSRQRNRQVGRYCAFAYAPFAGQNEDFVRDASKVLVNLFLFGLNLVVMVLFNFLDV
jgi:hypothetical protein